MWSIYDTCILMSGITTAAIAVVPIKGIEMRTRLLAGLCGGGLVVVSLILGSLRFFRYPAIVVVGPFIAAGALGVIIWEARRKGSVDAGRQFNETSSGVDAVPGMPGPAAQRPEAVAAASSPEAGGEWSTGYVTEAVTLARAPIPVPPPPQDDDASAQLLHAWTEVHVTATTSSRLADIVGRYPEFGPAVLAHPNCYPELAAWIRDLDIPESTPADTLYRPIFVESVGQTQPRFEPTGPLQTLEPHPAVTSPPVAPAAKPRRRWVFPVVGGSAAVLVLVIVVTLLPRGETTTAAVPASTPTVVTPIQPAEEPEPTVDSPSSTAEPEASAVICWDSRGAGQLATCGQPRGRLGLRYIYPSLASQWDRCAYKAYRQTTATYDCQFSGGLIRYRYWSNTAEARRHYERKYADADQSELMLDGQAVGTIYRATTSGQGVLTMTAWWGGGHYSLSVEASQAAVREELWKRVAFRAPADLGGHRPGVAPRIAVVG